MDSRHALISCGLDPPAVRIIRFTARMDQGNEWVDGGRLCQLNGSLLLNYRMVIRIDLGCLYLLRRKNSYSLEDRLVEFGTW